MQNINIEIAANGFSVRTFTPKSDSSPESDSLQVFTDGTSALAYVATLVTPQQPASPTE